MFDARQQADYELFFDASEALVRPWLPQAEAFVAACTALAETDPHLE